MISLPDADSRCDDGGEDWDSSDEKVVVVECSDYCCGTVNWSVENWFAAAAAAANTVSAAAAVGPCRARLGIATRVTTTPRESLQMDSRVSLVEAVVAAGTWLVVVVAEVQEQPLYFPRPIVALVELDILEGP